jgi:Pectate lyase superfamily protein
MKPFPGSRLLLNRIPPILCGLTLSLAARAENIVFPDDVIINVKHAPYNAKGDGVADDTAALQQALLDGCGHKVVYLPNGTYLIKDTLRFHCLGPMVYGQSSEGTVFRLANNAAGFDDPSHPKPVILSMTITGRISADQFFRKLKHFTVDSGNNAGAIGVRMYSNNEGILQHVRIKGNGAGKIGVDLGWMDQNGPMLMRDCIVDGFDTGVRAGAWVNSQTLCNVVLTNCRTYGLDIGMQVFSCEGLDIHMAAGNNNAIYTHHGSMLTLINSTLRGSADAGAIKNDGGNLFLRDVTTVGFASAVCGSNDTATVAGPKITEYSSGGVKKLFDDSMNHSLRLPIKPTPDTGWESDTNNWISVAAFGAKFGDNQDDTAAFQKAVDTAADAGKTVVYIPTVRGGDPNWYTLNGTVTIHGSVKSIMGLNFSRVIGNGKFLVRSDVSHPVEFTGIYGFGGEPPYIQNDSEQPMLVRNSEGRVLANSAADVFLEDLAGSIAINNPKAHVWARQLNPESPNINALNNGGTLWILGYKTENYGIKIDTRSGGKSELLGAHVYTGFGRGDKATTFRITGSSATFAGVRDITFSGNGYSNSVTEIRGSETRMLPRGKSWAAWTLYSGAQE